MNIYMVQEKWYSDVWNGGWEIHYEEDFADRGYFTSEESAQAYIDRISARQFEIQRAEYDKKIEKIRAQNVKIAESNKLREEEGRKLLAQYLFLIDNGFEAEPPVVKLFEFIEEPEFNFVLGENYRIVEVEPAE